MALTFDEFLKLASVTKKLFSSIYYFGDAVDSDDSDADSDFDEPEMDRKNQIVAASAIDYLELFKDSKYFKFLEEVRISSTKICQSLTLTRPIGYPLTRPLRRKLRISADSC